MGKKRELRGTSRCETCTSQTVVYLSAEQRAGHESPTIASLPCGVLSNVFEYLGPRDLAAASCVCKGWRRLVALEAAANKVWRSFYSARWQLSGAHWPPPPHHQHDQHQYDRRQQHQRQQHSTRAASNTSSITSALTVSGGCSSTTPEVRWQWAYGTKMLRLRSWSGRYSSDQVVGHKSAVRAVRLLPSHQLLATASLDRTVRLWDLASGLPLAASRPHGGTVRCLALDTHLLASGCSDNLVRLWRPRPTAANGTTSALPLYDIASKPYLLRGHTGPVSCLALDDGGGGWAAGGDGDGGSTGCIFSGSWDCTVRIWRQEASGAKERQQSASSSDVSDGGEASEGAGSGSSSDSSGGGGSGSSTAASRPRRSATGGGDESGGWSCAGVLQYSDWVYCCAVRGGNLLVAAGSEVVVTDAATGRAVRRFAGLHDGGAVSCLEGCRSGRLLFTAAGDGLLLAHDLRMKHGSRVMWHHNAAVTGLAFEDPWLASSSADGCIILQDSEQALAGGGGPQRAFNASCRSLHCPTGQPALCLDLADQWLAAGTDSGVVRLWDFTGAAAAAERAAAARTARAASKAARHASRHLPQQAPHPPPHHPHPHPHHQQLQPPPLQPQPPPPAPQPPLQNSKRVPEAASAPHHNALPAAQPGPGGSAPGGPAASPHYNSLSQLLPASAATTDAGDSRPPPPARSSRDRASPQYHPATGGGGARGWDNGGGGGGGSYSRERGGAAAGGGSSSSQRWRHGPQPAAHPHPHLHPRGHTRAAHGAPQPSFRYEGYWGGPGTGGEGVSGGGMEGWDRRAGGRQVFYR